MLSIAAPVSHTVSTSTVITQRTASGVRASNLAIKIRFPAQATHHLFSKAASGSAAHPHSKPKATSEEGGLGGLSDHSNASSADAKNDMSYISTPPHAFMEHTGTTFAFICYKIYFMCTVNGKHKYEMTPN